ncbi:MAG: caspase family protein [Bryobacterales bacterium]|nr:caspase family protein [Bryobacterales bacterium]
MPPESRPGFQGCTPCRARVFATWICFAVLSSASHAGAPQTEPGGRRDLSFERIDSGSDLDRQGKLWAIVIGISHYKNLPPQSQLRFAHRDAETFAAFLRSPNGGGFPSSHLKVLLEENATLSAMRTALGTWLARSAEPGDVVYVFFAGHGVTESERDGYLLGYDSDPQDLYATALPVAELDKIITERIRARTVVLLVDACHAGHIGWSARGTAEQSLISRYLDEIGEKGRGVLRLLASRADERSFESDEWGGGHGAFTHFLLEGLQGKADRNGDGVVRATELSEYLAEVVPERTKALQHPRAAGHFDPSLPLSVLNRARPAPVPALVTLELHGPAGSEVYLDNTYRGRIRPSEILLIDSVHAGPHELSIDSPGAGSVSQRLVLAAAKTILNLTSALPGGASVPSSPLAAMVHSALGSGKILEPGGAWELYQQLVRERAGDPQRGAIEAALSAALAAIGQRAINDYVQLPPTELRPDTFHRAARAFHFQKVLEPGETQLDAKRLFSEGRALIVERNYPQAIEALRQAAALDPKAAYSHNALGLAHEALRKDDEATRDFQTAAKLAPAWPLPHLHLGMQYQRRNKLDAAERELKLAVQLGPRQAYLREALGTHYRVRGRYADAEEEINRLIGLNAGYAPAYRELGLICQASAQHKKAVQAFDAYLKLAPDAGDAVAVRGLLAKSRQLAERKPPTLKR